MSENIVEQIRKMVKRSADGGCYPASTGEDIIGGPVTSMDDELKVFSTIADRIESEYMELPLDADGELIKPGDKVRFVGGDVQFEVFGYDFEDGELLVHIGRGDRTSTDANVLPTEITHKQPDTLERIEEDASMASIDYCNKYALLDIECNAEEGDEAVRHCTDCWLTCETRMVRHLLRRQREVLESGQA